MKRLLTVVSLASLLALAPAGTALGDEPNFDELDQDKDGSLSKAEASKVPGLDFAKADANKDGRIDRYEYEAALS